MLIGLLCIAVALGIGIGVLVASLKTAGPRPITVKGSPAIKQRFVDLQTEMQGRADRGEPVPPLAWELVAKASSALMNGQEALAAEKIEEAERLLKSQPGRAER